MAKIYPTLENINRLKVQPTDGELFLIKYLINNLPNDIEIYFQPFLNGDMPDIILMQENIGVSIIEVKDWNLDLYKIDEHNKWFLKENNALLKSPFQQVFNYKDNLFNLHINGLLKEKIKNKQFYGRIQPYVYFHKATKNNIESFYYNILSYYKRMEQECHDDFKTKKVTYENYEKRLNYIKQKQSKIERDIKYHAVGNDNLQKIQLPKNNSNLFTESIYKEFQRYLQPPYHTLQEGIEIKYTKKQEKLIKSQPIHQKIKGVAGSGKTVVLAKRAVNAHKRHNDMVLILTYNITLKSYIHDKISDVREDFSWKYFYITNYHQLITQTINNLGIEINLPDNISENEKSTYLDKYYYSNFKLFEPYKDEINKYKSIFIDEIQDYKPEWIKIIREYFLVKTDSEMVLFGDEKQNIYNRELDAEHKPKIVQGFGRWEYLNKSVRHQGDGGRILDLAKRFQKTFFQNKYEIDVYDDSSNTPSLNLGIYKIAHYENNNIALLVDIIMKEIKNNNIHPNDIAILSTNIDLLKEVDYIIRKNYNENTLTTFETKEMFKHNKNDIEKIRKNKKIAFNLNNGMMKLSTIHSFKGYEVSTLFLIIDEDDNEEMIYAGITRSKFDIMIFTHRNSKYNDFFYIDLERDYNKS